MTVDILTIFPQMISDAVRYGVLGRAIAKGILSIRAVDLREFTDDDHRTTDDTPLGGGRGMILKPEPVARALQASASDGAPDRVLLMDPQGERFSDSLARDLKQCSHIAIVCGRYEGVDDRIRTLLVTDTVSIGDYVLSGGELAALVVADAVSRMLPGVLGWEEAATRDSFADELLDYPQFTRPRTFLGSDVPKVLLDGHHADIATWRFRQQLDRTRRLRPDLWSRRVVTTAEIEVLAGG